MPVEIAFRSTGSVSDFFVSPDGTSGRLYKTVIVFHTVLLWLRPALSWG